jgi:hypothetical protein
MASLQSFRGLIFADACNHAHYSSYNRTYFVGLNFADSRLSAKIRPHENFPLYGILAIILSHDYDISNILVIVVKMLGES